VNTTVLQAEEDEGDMLAGGPFGHTSEIRNRRREGCLLMLPLSAKMKSLRMHTMVS